MKKLKMLMLANYFYPDVASLGQLMTELAEELQDDIDITVVAAFPNYTGKIPEKYKGKRVVEESHENIKILRVRVPEFDKTNKISRIKYILAYFFNSIVAIAKSGHQNIIYTTSQPPILGGVLGIIGKIFKRAKLIYNIQDFNPEQTEAVGYSKNKFIIEFARMIDKINCKLSNLVIIVGRDMQHTLNKRFNNKKVPKNIVINNWTDENRITPLQSDNYNIIQFKEKYEIKDKFIFMYSGNIGLFYDLENIIKVIREFKDDKEVAFVFVGEGAMKQKLIDYCNENNLDNVVFIPYQDKSDLIYSLNAADIHWVVNAKGIKGVSVPSKLYGVMASGKPVLGVLDEGSEARLIVEESNCGVCSEPGNYKQISQNLRYILENKLEVQLLGINGRKYLEANLTKDVSINKYKETILSLGCEKELVPKENA